VFRRGFKSWCENVAIQQRRELGVRAIDPLDPRLLARHLGIRVWTAEEVPGVEPQHLKTLLHDDSDSWSAATICVGSKDLIVLNSSHSPARQSSDLMHELSHVLLGHEPARVDVTEDGLLMLNTFDRLQEEEASWLAGCLLLPRNALMAIRGRGLDLRTAARNFGVSLDMLRYRMKVTGVEYQLARAR
jgi:hypothetical protein